MLKFHFLNVGQGSMVVGIFPNGETLVYDCNITEENQKDVFRYLSSIMPKRSIDVFINSHRDADHMRGIKKLNSIYPIQALWDSGVSGNIEAPEYIEYMDFRRSVPYTEEVKPHSHWRAYPIVKIINGKRSDFFDDPNSQSVVLHINYNGSALLLAGDTCSTVWENHIIPELGDSIKSLVLFASHHGSFSFFCEDRENGEHFIDHLVKINPAISIISVGENNQHGHPDIESIAYYEQYCYGASNGQKIFRTDLHGNMLLELNGGGTGHIYWNR